MMLADRSVSKTLAVELAAQEPLFDKDGLSVAMSSVCWRLNSVVGSNVLDWRLFGDVEGDIARAVVAFVRYNVERNSAGHCCNVFRYLAAMTAVAQRPGTKDLRESVFGYLWSFVRLALSGSFTISATGIDGAAVRGCRPSTIAISITT